MMRLKDIEMRRAKMMKAKEKKDGKVMQFDYINAGPTNFPKATKKAEEFPDFEALAKKKK